MRELARQPAVVARGLGEDVARRERLARQRQLRRQHPQHRHAQLVRVLGEGLEERLVARDLGRVAARLGHVVHVVLADVEEFRRVRPFLRVRLLDHARFFVPKQRHPLDQRVLPLVLHRVVKGLVRHLQQFLRFREEVVPERRRH